MVWDLVVLCNSFVYCMLVLLRVCWQVFQVKLDSGLSCVGMWC